MAFPILTVVTFLPIVGALFILFLVRGDEEAVASVRFRRPPGFEGLFVHKVTLQPGEYEARITVYREDGRGIEHRRVLFVPSDGQTRFDLRE